MKKIVEVSSDDTDRSEAASGMGDVEEELAMFTNVKKDVTLNSIGSPTGGLMRGVTTMQKDEQDVSALNDT